ncbi:MAG: redoxin domain-containing protein [bacterium]
MRVPNLLKRVILLCILVGFVDKFLEAKEGAMGTITDKCNLASCKISFPAKPQESKADNIAKDFTLKDILGKGYFLQMFRGKVILLHFEATWCGGCQCQAKNIEGVWKRYKSKGVQILSIYSGEGISAVVDYRKHYGITYPQLIDPSYRISREYEAHIVPYTIIIDQNMKVRYKCGLVGFFSPLRLIDELFLWWMAQKKTLPGEEISLPKEQPEIKGKEEIGIIEITKGAGLNEFSTTLTDNSGNVWVVWCEKKDERGNIYARYYNGEVLSEKMDVSGDKGDNYQPRISLDSSGNVWIAWASNREGNYNIYARYYDGENWSEIIKVTSDKKDEMHPVIACDNTNRIWFAWYRWTPMSLLLFRERGRHVFAKYYDNKSGVWSKETLITQDFSKWDHHSDPEITVDNQGKIWLSWTTNYHPECYKPPKRQKCDGPSIFAKCYDDDNWGTPTVVSIDTQGQHSRNNYYSKITADNSGGIWIVWEGASKDFKKRNIYVKYYKDGKWSEVIPVSSYEGVESSPIIRLDRENNPWVLWKRDVDGRWDIYGSYYQNSKWTSPFPVISSSDDVNSYGLAVDKMGKIYVVWSSYDEYGNSNVYIKSILRGEK